MGKLYGVGVGPGDPELITLKAVKVLNSVDVIAFFAKSGNTSHSLRVASQHIPENVELLPLEYPVTTELDRHSDEYKKCLDNFHDSASEQLASLLSSGRSVAVISEGDPLFFGSFMHLHIRLSHHFSTEVIPGVTGMSGSWSAAQMPICQGDDVFSVVPGTLPLDQLESHLMRSEAVVIMKVGRHLKSVRQALENTGRMDKAFYIERATQADSDIRYLKDKQDDTAPYFSLILVPGWAPLGFESPVVSYRDDAFITAAKGVEDV